MNRFNQWLSLILLGGVLGGLPTPLISQENDRDLSDEVLQIEDRSVFDRISERWDELLDDTRHDKYKTKITFKPIDYFSIGLSGSGQKLTEQEVWENPYMSRRRDEEGPQGPWMRFDIMGRVGVPVGGGFSIGPIRANLQNVLFADRRWLFEVHVHKKHENKLFRDLYAVFKELGTDLQYPLVDLKPPYRVGVPKSLARAQQVLQPGESLTVEGHSGSVFSASLSLPIAPGGIPISVGASLFSVVRGEKRQKLLRLNHELFRLRTAKVAGTEKRRGRSYGAVAGLDLLQLGDLGKVKLNVNILSVGSQSIENMPWVFDYAFNPSLEEGKRAFEAALAGNWVPTQEGYSRSLKDGVDRGIYQLEEVTQYISEIASSLSLGFNLEAGIEWNKIKIKKGWNPGAGVAIREKDGETDTNYTQGGLTLHTHTEPYERESSGWLHNIFYDPTRTNVKAQLFDEFFLSDLPPEPGSQERTFEIRRFWRQKLLYRYEVQGGDPDQFLDYVARVAGLSAPVEVASLEEALSRGQMKKDRRMWIDAHFYHRALQNIFKADENYVWYTTARAHGVKEPLRWRYESTRKKWVRAQKEIIDNCYDECPYEEDYQEAREAYRTYRKAQKLVERFLKIGTLNREGLALSEEKRESLKQEYLDHLEDREELAAKLQKERGDVTTTPKFEDSEESADFLTYLLMRKKTEELRHLFKELKHHPEAFVTFAMLANQDDNPLKNSRSNRYAEGLDILFGFHGKDRDGKETNIQIRHVGTDPAKRTKPIDPSGT